MSNVFDYVNSVSFDKKHLMRDTENDVLAEKDYVPFLTNRALSYHVDTCLLANEMNHHPGLDNLLQYEFFLNSIRPRRRFGKWGKSNIDGDDLEAVQRYFGYGINKARVALATLTRSQIDEIKNITNTDTTTAKQKEGSDDVSAKPRRSKAKKE